MYTLRWVGVSVGHITDSNVHRHKHYIANGCLHKQDAKKRDVFAPGSNVTPLKSVKSGY